jgi:hypothetical protein
MEGSLLMRAVVKRGKMLSEVVSSEKSSIIVFCLYFPHILFVCCVVCVLEPHGSTVSGVDIPHSDGIAGGAAHRRDVRARSESAVDSVQDKVK